MCECGSQAGCKPRAGGADAPPLNAPAAAVHGALVLASPRPHSPEPFFPAPLYIRSTLFSESLCPDCQNFILGKYWELYQTPGIAGEGGIANIQQYVYGNARGAPGKITCQHGPVECLMNTAQNCLIALANGNVSQWLPAIHCLEGFGTNQEKHLTACATASGYSTSAVNTCWKGAQGKALDLAAAAATPADHQYVPWLTVNGVNICTEAGCDTVLAATCAAYKGPKPAACGKAAAEQQPARGATAAACPIEW